MARGRKLETQITRGIELQAAAQEFYRHNRTKGLTERTQRTYEHYLSGFIKWYGEDRLVGDINYQVLEDYMAFKMETMKGVSVATVMRHLRAFFRFCLDREYMGQINVTIPRYEKEQKQPYTPEEMRLLLQRPKTNNWVEYRNWCMVNYFYGTGQRLSTVINIKVEHLDLAAGTVFLAHNKDKIQKTMPLSSALIKILREYISLSSLQPQDYLFPEYEGKQLQIRSAQDAIAGYNHSRGVEKTSIHLFRHAFAREYILAGGSPAKLQKLLNHKTIHMTMRYVNLYSNDIGVDLDQYDPLSHVQHQPQKRRTV